jgi:PST family polysaccharide transporter
MIVRLLTPHDYGIVALAGLVLGLLTILNDFGLDLAIVAYRKLTESEMAQLNVLAVVVGAAAVAVSCAAAVVLAHPLDAPELPTVTAALSAVLFVASLRTVAIGRLKKELRFARLAVAETVASLSTSASTIVLALAGFQYWALVLGQIVGQVILTAVVLSWVPPRFARPRPAALREILTFSRAILVGRLAWYVQTRADEAIVGTLLGRPALGIYSLAESLGRMPVEKIGALLSQVTPAFVAAHQGDRDRLKRLTLTLTEALALSMFPIAAGMLLLAPACVGPLLGSRWLDIVAPLQVFAIAATVDAVGTVFFPVLVVTGGARLSMYIGLAGSVVLPAAFYFGSAWGVVGVATAYAVGAPLLRIPAYLGVARRTGLTLTRYIGALWPALSATCVMALVMLAVRALLPVSWPLAIRVASEVLSGALAYVLLLTTLHRSSVVRFCRVFGSVRGAPPADTMAAADLPSPPVAA